MTPAEKLANYIHLNAYDNRVRDELLDALRKVAVPKCTYTRSPHAGSFRDGELHHLQVIIGETLYDESYISDRYGRVDPGFEEYIKREMKQRMGHAIMDALWPEDEDG